MKAPYYVFPPMTEDDWWGVYGPNDIEKAFERKEDAEKFCNELNFEAGKKRR